MQRHWQDALAGALEGRELDSREAVALADAPVRELCGAARELRERGHGRLVTYSPKVFVPLTTLCRDVCHYCTFARPPRRGERAFMRAEEVLAIARAGAAAGCHEALFTLGDKPELRYRVARAELAELGCETTLEYLARLARLVLEETGLLPHLNPGVMSAADLAALRSVSASMGIMLETASDRLSGRGGPHFGSPDKLPARRLETIRSAGEGAVPFTTGILIGIGETREERIEALLAIRDLGDGHGHVQEVIVQNFRAKPGTRMAGAAEPSLDDLLWTAAAARVVLGADWNVQAPPNLSYAEFPRLLDAGINDWGGISPVTIDHVNPEAPWPEVDRLRRATEERGLVLAPRLPVYPEYVAQLHRWVDAAVGPLVLRRADGEGLARDSAWAAGAAARGDDGAGLRGWSAGAAAPAETAPSGERWSRGGLHTPLAAAPTAREADAGATGVSALGESRAAADGQGSSGARPPAPPPPADGGGRIRPPLPTGHPAVNGKGSTRPPGATPPPAVDRERSSRASLPTAPPPAKGRESTRASLPTAPPPADGRGSTHAARPTPDATANRQGSTRAQPLTSPSRVGTEGSINHPPPGVTVAPRPSQNRADSGTTLAPAVARALAKVGGGVELDEDDAVALFRARGRELRAVLAAADRLRREVCGDTVTYVVTRNINYTNVCYFRCGFCAFSKGKLAENLRGRPYLVPLDEVVRRCDEAWQRGAVEVCLQGGIHPAFTGEYYLELCRAIRAAAPDLHVHAFSALEVWQGAGTLGEPLDRYLRSLRAAGLASLPGTAAEILDDEVRRVICPDKLTTAQWLRVHDAAHRAGLRSTTTMMFGHVEGPRSWARHLLRLRDQQRRSGGFTEFVPLPFVHMEAPIYLKGRARPGPTFREALLVHAVARLVLHPEITNIQTSWVKMGPDGARAALRAGANDLGGTLMNESISRAAGAEYGQEMTPEAMEAVIRSLGRTPRQRTTLYGTPPAERVRRSFAAAPLAEPVNPSVAEAGLKAPPRLVRPGLRTSARR